MTRKFLVGIILLFLLLAGCSAQDSGNVSKDKSEAEVPEEEVLAENVENVDEDSEENAAASEDVLVLTAEEESNANTLIKQLYEYEKQMDFEALEKLVVPVGSEEENHSLLRFEEFIYGDMIIESYEVKEMKKIRENVIHIVVAETRAGFSEKMDLLLKQNEAGEWKFDFDGIVAMHELSGMNSNEYGNFGNFIVVERLEGTTEIWFEILNTSLDYAIYLGREDFGMTVDTEEGQFTEQPDFNTLPNVLESIKTITPNAPPFYNNITFQELKGKIRTITFENIELIDKNNNKTQLGKIEIPVN